MTRDELIEQLQRGEMVRVADLTGVIERNDLLAMAAMCGQAETLSSIAGGTLTRRQDEVSTLIQQASSRRTAQALRTQMAVAS